MPILIENMRQFFYLPWQFGNPVKPGEQNVHLSPIMLVLQGHFPVSSSQEISLEPSSLHSQAEILILKYFFLLVNISKKN